MALKVKVSRGKLDAAVAKFAPTLNDIMAKTELEQGHKLADRIRARAPRSAGPGGKYGHYADSIEAARLDGKDLKNSKSTVALQTKDKNAVGIFANFYWRFLEFGTVKMSARPHVMPTYRANKKRIRSAMARALNTAVKKIKAGA